MKLLTIIIILISNINYSFSQEPKSRIEIIDSLKKELKNSDNQSKVDIYVGLSRKYFQYNTDTGLLYGNKALFLSKEIGYVLGTAESYNVIAFNFSIRGEIDSSYIYLLKAKELFEAVDDYEKVGDVFVILSINNNNNLKYDDAIENLDSAINIYDKLGLINKKASAYVNYGNALMGMAKYEEALNKFFTSIEIFKESNMLDRLKEPYLNIGNCFNNLMDYDNAIKYYEYTKKYSDSNEVSQLKATLLNNLGEVYILRNNLSKAEENLIEAYRINKLIGNNLFLCTNLSNLAKISLLQDDLKKADIYLNESINISEPNNLLEQIQISYFYKAELYRKKYQNKKNNNEGNSTLFKALNYLEKSEEIANKFNDKRKLLDIYDLKSQIYYLLQKYDEAYISISKYNII